MASTQPKIYTEEDYYRLPENVRAELIDGQIYYQAAPSRIHQKILMELSATIRDHIRSHKGICEVYPAPFAVKLFDNQDDTVEPDISVICDPKKLTDKGCTGAPDWIIEIISPSTASHDYIYKLNLYAKAGVREYWIVDPNSRKILVYYLEESGFKMDAYTFQSKIGVNIYDDLQIDFKALGL